MSGSNL